jgi:catechol 2,3-dioxygenase-like lactoylglutathione lyase family enzyme
MDIKRVDHYSIRTNDLEASRSFYTEVIGLKAGPRPPFNFPGYWLYSGEPPASLQSGRATTAWCTDGHQSRRSGVAQRLRRRSQGRARRRHRLPRHIAFAAVGTSAMIERCRGNSVTIFERACRSSGCSQMFVKDPDGVTIELNYPASEVAHRGADRRFPIAARRVARWKPSGELAQPRRSARAARAMVPRLERARRDAEALRRCPDETVRELNESGLMRSCSRGASAAPRPTGWRSST